MSMQYDFTNEEIAMMYEWLNKQPSLNSTTLIEIATSLEINKSIFFDSIRNYTEMQLERKKLFQVGSG